MIEAVATSFTRHVPLEISVGHFRIQTLSTPEQLSESFRLRYRTFQVEKIGVQGGHELSEDTDEFDALCDHLGIYDDRTGQLIATARLNCSLFSKRFYSSQEFHCDALLELPGVKLELGRVCVHRDFRKGIILMLLWRAIATYMVKTETAVLFGCGSIDTQSAEDAVLVYRHLHAEKTLELIKGVRPTDRFRSPEFDRLLLQQPLSQVLTPNETARAQSLLPPLCKSYFNIGCYVPSTPAFDTAFACVDFLTVLETHRLDPKVRQKMMGLTS